MQAVLAPSPLLMPPRNSSLPRRRYYCRKRPQQMVSSWVHPLNTSKANSRHAIMDNRVSKQHFRVYSIIYEANSSDFPPLIYCEDLESSNGTYVNDVLIGKITHERIGYLLCDGDVVEIRPLWRFRVHQRDHQLITRSKGLWSDLEVTSFHSANVETLNFLVLARPF